MSEQCPVCLNAIDPGAASCPVCGFKLMGATQRFAPVAATEREAATRPQGGGTPTLKVLRGRQEGATYVLEDRPMTIGRSPQCDIFLNDMTVSRMHAVVEREGCACVIRDENSYNGLWVNDRSVETKALSDGDLIQIGAFTLEFCER